MASKYQEEENRISMALEVYKRDKNRKLSALARDFAVPYQRLRRRAQGVSSKIGNQNRPRLLTEAQEQAIVRTIDHLRRYNIKFNGRDIEDFANLLLWREYERDHPEAKIPKSKSILARLAKREDWPPGLKLVNHQWAYDFIQRIDPNLGPIADEQIDCERATVTAAMVQNWFDGLEPIIKKIKHYNIYNFDESGFMLGQQPSRTRSIGRQRARAEVNLSKRESQTIIECIAADGFAIPPFLIFRGSVILERWFEDQEDDDWYVSVAETGFVNSNLAFTWLQHFDKHTYSRAKNSKFYTFLVFFKLIYTN
jgi:DDE superfamily endonuclease